MIIAVSGTDSKEKAAKLVGKSVVYKTQTGKDIKGNVASSHGNKGAIRVIFEKGMPGQSLGKKVDIKA
jgi:large subunit ribosomal protein L35Ae